MKSEERHELVQNDLEKLIERLRGRYATIMVDHGNRILLWISVVLLLIAASIYYSRTSRSTNADGWSAFIGAQSPEDLAGIAEAYAGSPVGQWARLNVGEQYLQSGVRLMFTDREASQTDLKEAKAAFEDLLNQPQLTSAVRERALFGLARTLESTSDGNLKPAIEAYQKLLADFPQSPYKPVVEKQIKSLENSQTQEFYAWFAAQKPEPQDREQPADLMNSLNLEQLQEEMKAGTQTPAAESPAATQTPASAEQTPLSVPAAPEFPPAGEKKPEMKTAEPAPAEPATPPATDKPATENPPAEKPATEKPAEQTEKPAEKPPESPAPAEPAAEKPAEPAPSETESPSN